MKPPTSYPKARLVCFEVEVIEEPDAVPVVLRGDWALFSMLCDD